MKIESIDSDDAHAAALKEIERLWRAEAGTADGDELDRLMVLVEVYEEIRWPIDGEAAADLVVGVENDLDELLDDLTDDNCHGEISTGKAVGNEE